MSKIIYILTIALILSPTIYGQMYSLEDSKVFNPGNEKVILISETSNRTNKIIVFKAPLRINTDGARTSYHPQDPDAAKMAMNSICNAISVDPKVSCEMEKDLFRKWRDTGYKTFPRGYTIKWENVLAPVFDPSGKRVPCVYSTEPQKGYFGSLTSLKNDLPAGARGECEYLNQVDSLLIPHLVRAGGTNPIKTFGGKIGDLVIAHYPKTKVTVFAVIGDEGPTDNLGEGSVAMNMALLKASVPPTNYTDTKKYSIGEDVWVAILPCSASYKSQKPYTAQNIVDRVRQWQLEKRFADNGDFLSVLFSFAQHL